MAQASLRMSAVLSEPSWSALSDMVRMEDQTPNSAWELPRHV